jgi:prepilin-type N-terminal cleavage/methylation domain-containing protein
MCSAKRRSAKRQSQAGLSLIESLVTMAIMSVGVLGLSASAIELSRTAKWADMSAAATGLATRRLELIRSQPLGSAYHTPGSYNAGSPMNADGMANGPYTITWVVSGNDMCGTAPNCWGLRTVTVTASWTQYNKARQVQVGGLVRCSRTPCP